MYGRHCMAKLGNQDGNGVHNPRSRLVERRSGDRLSTKIIKRNWIACGNS